MKKTSLLTDLQKENLKRLKSCNKKSEGATTTKVRELGIEVPNTCGGMIALKLQDLERELQEGLLVEKINIESNSKLVSVPTISFPNIFVQSTFMRLVNLNPEWEEKFESVRILMEYFREHKVCHNCEGCCGLCYNNKFEYGKPAKAISELRVLLAYITDKQALANKILQACKFVNVFRINANGEIHSNELLTFWINIAKRKKNTVFFTYTKSFGLFEGYLEKNNLPKNMIVNMSVFDGQQEKLSRFENLYAGNKFVVVNEIPDGAKNICCGDCSKCGGFDLGFCMRKLPKKNNTIYVEYHN